MQFSSAVGSNIILTVWLALGMCLLYLPMVILAIVLDKAWLLIGIGILPGIIGFLAWYAKRFVAGIHIAIDQEVLRLKTGVWWKRELVMPLRALRTVEMVETPLMRRFGCVNIWLRFTGGMTVLPFVQQEDMIRIRQFWEST